ncbi:zeatin o-glucosyltransferase [Quercus suber]|uniref:Zeatin o-glucosyltransferase n=1 Tax=Quercus suber TaxID=58331 RepID=A0AAW0KY42_QUESU
MPNNGLNKTKVITRPSQPAPPPLSSYLSLQYPSSLCLHCHTQPQAMLRVHGWDPNSVSNIHFHDLKIPPFLTPPPNPNSPNKFPSHLQPLFNASLHLRDPMASLLRELSSKATRIIVINDSMMASVVQDLVTIPNAESYTFHSVSAFTYFFNGQPLELETNAKLVPKGLHPLKVVYKRLHKLLISLQIEFQKLSSGVLYNTCRVIEGTYMDLNGNARGRQEALGYWPFNP